MTQMKCSEPHPAWNKMAIVQQAAEKCCWSKTPSTPSSPPPLPPSSGISLYGTQFAKPALGHLYRTLSSVLPGRMNDVRKKGFSYFITWKASGCQS